MERCWQSVASRTRCSPILFFGTHLLETCVNIILIYIYRCTYAAVLPVRCFCQVVLLRVRMGMVDVERRNVQEKTIAARRAGCKTLVFPEANRWDLGGLPMSDAQKIPNPPTKLSS